jgi:two-component system chemotaxis sensor kinase CheA
MFDADILNEFLTESNEHLLTVEDDVLALERSGAVLDEETVNRLFRSVHTVKGGAGFLNMVKVKDLAHALENVVGAIRGRTLVPGTKVSEVLLTGVDKLRGLLANVNDDSVDISADVAACKAILGGGSPVVSTNSPPPKGKTFDLAAYDLAPIRDGLHYLHECTIDLAAACAEKKCAPADLFNELQSVGAIVDASEDIKGLKTAVPDAGGRHLYSFLLASVIDDGDILIAGMGCTPIAIALHDPSKIAPAAAKPSAQPVRKPEAAETTAKTSDAPRPPQNALEPQDAVVASKKPTAASGGDQTVRISLGVLDNLMNLASELVLVRNQNLQAISRNDLQQLAAIGQRLNVVTSDLQNSIMQTRMRPVGTIFNRFSRVVRDLSKKLGKTVRLEIEGADVELDKTIIEAIADPMTHLVRNAVDHGVELPDDRVAKGKDPEGCVRLKAFHQAGQVNIQITDDGKGMDTQMLRAKAVEKGLLTKNQAAGLSEKEAFALIFEPGFSLANEVTEISGRGVGMDVVRSGIKALGGTVDIVSAPGKGSTIRIELPLTLAIIPVLIVAVENAYFALSQVSIVEVLWLHGQDVYQSIKMVDNREVYWLRGKLLPLLRLSKVLRIDTTFLDPETQTTIPDRRAQIPDRRQNSEPLPDQRHSGVVDRRTSIANSLYIVVMRLGGERFGLVVDTVVDTEEIVVKPLHDQLKLCKVFAGNAVLGNGHVAMILDIAAIAELSGLKINGIEERADRNRSSGDDRQTVLLFDVGGEERFALPLCLITRVQEVKRSEIQRAQGKEFINYRDALMPLLYLDQALPGFKAHYSSEVLSVIIPKTTQPFGIVVSHVVDTVDIPTQLDAATVRISGIVGTQVIGKHLVLFLDPLVILEKTGPVIPESEGRQKEIQRRILVVDDSLFYQNLLRSFLSGTGASVTVAANGKEALLVLGKSNYDMIVCDIEMPVMDGFEFVRRVKENAALAGVPVLGVSAVDDKYLRPRALDCGFDEFKTKSSLEDIQAAIRRLLEPKKNGSLS